MQYETEIVWRIKLDLQPVPKQSMKVRIIAGRPQMYPPPSSKKYVALLVDLLSTHKPPEPFAGPLQVEIVTCLPFLKSEKKATRERGWRFKDTSPDWDNYGKPLCDAMEGIVFKNDGQIARGIVTKIVREQAYVLVIVSRLQELKCVAKNYT